MLEVVAQVDVRPDSGIAENEVSQTRTDMGKFELVMRVSVGNGAEEDTREEVVGERLDGRESVSFMPQVRDYVPKYLSELRCNRIIDCCLAGFDVSFNVSLVRNTVPRSRSLLFKAVIRSFSCFSLPVSVSRTSARE